MSDTPFALWPSFTQEEADAVAEVLLSGKVNAWTGDRTRHFEDAFARFCGSTHAIALANGTVALDLALYGLGIGARNGGSAADEVIVTPRSFMASVSTIVNAGARTVFADVDADSQNITPETVAPLLTSQTRAILCVHLAGWPCDMDGFRTLTEGTGIRLIEDCAQAHGALCRGRPVGALGDVAAWSFCQDKIMTTGGEGGMVTCNDPALWDRMWSYKDHGRDWQATFQQQHPPGFRWLLNSFGTNWRLTEMQSAIGLIQLGRMPDWQAKRQAHAAALADALEPFTGPDGLIRLPVLDKSSGDRHGWYKFYSFLRPERLAPGWSQDRFVAAIADHGVPCFHGSCPEIYLEKAFDGTGFRPTKRLPVARKLGETSFMMLVHPTLTSENIARAQTVLADVCAQASA